MNLDEQSKENLIKIYKAYNVIDWIIAIIIIGTPFVLITFEGLGLPGFSFESLMFNISNLPAAVIIPLFIIYSLYTVFCIVLYIKVWPIKEIPKGFTYWFDWILTIVLTVYELFIFYLILF